ncbi:MAG TPA: hypothetical protein VH092_12790 [Urbifossiella sp.]|nr:hypothetical protein [Urbifossiella sp.]
MPVINKPTVETAGTDERRQLYALRAKYMSDLFGADDTPISFEEFDIWWSELAPAVRTELEGKYRRGWQQELADGAERVRQALAGSEREPASRGGS